MCGTPTLFLFPAGMAFQCLWLFRCFGISSTSSACVTHIEPHAMRAERGQIHFRPFQLGYTYVFFFSLSSSSFTHTPHALVSVYQRLDFAMYQQSVVVVVVVVASSLRYVEFSSPNESSPSPRMQSWMWKKKQQQKMTRTRFTLIYAHCTRIGTD